MKSGLLARATRALRQSLRLVSPMPALVSGVKQWGTIRFDELVVAEGLRSASVGVTRETNVESNINNP